MSSLTGHDSKRVVMIVGDYQIDRRVLDQARSLSEDGWSVSVIACPEPSDTALRTESVFPEIDIIRINPYEVTERALKVDMGKIEPVLSFFPQFKWHEIFPDFIHQFLEAVLRPADIYVAHDLPQLPAAFCAAKLYGARLIYDSHEIFCEQTNIADQKETLLEVEKTLIQYVDKTITVNESIAKILQDRFHISLPEVILNCTSSHGRAVPVQKTNYLREHFSLDDKTPIFIFHGNLSPITRNLEALIEAFALTKKAIALVILGPDAWPGATEVLVQHATRLGVIGKKVFFHEAVPQDLLLDISGSADYGVIPYDGDDENTIFCTPNKLFEYLITGLPMIANDLPELRRFITGECVGIVGSMKNAHEICSLIERMLLVDLRAIRFRASKVASKYDWKIQGEKIQNIFRTVSDIRLHAHHPF